MILPLPEMRRAPAAAESGTSTATDSRGTGPTTQQQVNRLTQAMARLPPPCFIDPRQRRAEVHRSLNFDEMASMRQTKASTPEPSRY